MHTDGTALILRADNALYGNGIHWNQFVYVGTKVCVWDYSKMNNRHFTVSFEMCDA